LGCQSLKHGVGCQERNTSCTAWLCGFLKYIYYEAGLLGEWERFWEQIPGRSYREDYTPDYIPVSQWLDSPDLRFVSEAFAEDLKELKRLRDPFWLPELKEKLDRYVDRLGNYSDSEIRRTVEKKLKSLTKDFRRFRAAIEQL